MFVCIYAQHNKLLSLIYKYHNDRHFRKMFARDLLFTTGFLLGCVVVVVAVVVKNTHVPDILLSFVCLGTRVLQQERFIYLLCTVFVCQRTLDFYIEKYFCFVQTKVILNNFALVFCCCCCFQMNFFLFIN